MMVSIIIHSNSSPIFQSVHVFFACLFVFREFSIFQFLDDLQYKFDSLSYLLNRSGLYPQETIYAGSQVLIVIFTLGEGLITFTHMASSSQVGDSQISTSSLDSPLNSKSMYVYFHLNITLPSHIWQIMKRTSTFSCKHIIHSVFPILVNVSVGTQLLKQFSRSF